MVAPAAIQKRRPACAALPRINSQIGQHPALQKATPADAYRNIALAGGASHLVRPYHRCPSLELSCRISGVSPGWNSDGSWEMLLLGEVDVFNHNSAFSARHFGNLAPEKFLGRAADLRIAELAHDRKIFARVLGDRLGMAFGDGLQVHQRSEERRVG